MELFNRLVRLINRISILFPGIKYDDAFGIAYIILVNDDVQ